MKQRNLKIFLLMLFLFPVLPVRADDLSNNFSAHLTNEALDALAKDLGAVVGGGSFHEAKALGFPLGFDLGVHVPVVTLQDDNVILRDDGSKTHAVWGQAEIGLPGKINVIGRYGEVLDATMVGGGLRLGIINPAAPGLPALSVTGLYSRLDHDYFKMDTYSANLVLSLDIPVIHPYIGAGYDYSLLDPTEQAFNAATNNPSRDVDGASDGYRAEIGVNLSIIPFTYITLAGGLANGEPMYHAGAGVRF